MPLYEWKCPRCERHEERLQVGFQPVAPRCECGPFMVLVLNSPAIVWNGSGSAKKDRRQDKG